MKFGENETSVKGSQYVGRFIKILSELTHNGVFSQQTTNDRLI